MHRDPSFSAAETEPEPDLLDLFPELSRRRLLQVLRSRVGLCLWVIVILCAGIELLLVAADLGWIGQSHWRSRLLQFGGFWPGLLHNWRPNYAFQPQVMFLSYGLLHADLWHMIGNMIGVLIFGGVVCARLGWLGFLWIYIIASLGGAALFAVLATSTQPMVGASGALSGLLGAWQLWHWQGLRGFSRWPVLKIALWLVLLHVAMEVVQAGGVAWQTHLGGYLAGLAAAWIWGCRRYKIRP